MYFIAVTFIYRHDDNVSDLHKNCKCVLVERRESDHIFSRECVERLGTQTEADKMEGREGRVVRMKG